MVARFEIYNPKLLGKVVFHLGLMGAIVFKTIICDADGGRLKRRCPGLLFSRVSINILTELDCIYSSCIEVGWLVNNVQLSLLNFDWLV